MATIQALLHSEQVEASRHMLDAYRDKFPVVIDKHFLAAQFCPNFSSYPAIVAENVRGRRLAYCPGSLVTWSVVEAWLTAIDAESPQAVPEITFTRLDFLNRFTDQEKVLLKSLESSDPIVALFWEEFRSAETISLDDPRTVRALDYLVQQGHLTPARRTEVLGLS